MEMKNIFFYNKSTVNQSLTEQRLAKRNAIGSQ